jgi:hypothetical protein
MKIYPGAVWGKVYLFETTGGGKFVIGEQQSGKMSLI